MIIAVNYYYGNDVINGKGGEHHKHCAADVGGQMKNVFPAKERHFPRTKEFNSFFQDPLNKFLLQNFLKLYLALRCKEIKDLFIMKDITVRAFRLAC